MRQSYDSYTRLDARNGATLSRKQQSKSSNILQTKSNELKTQNQITNVIVISDTHCGCKLALCPPSVTLDEGGTYEHSPVQKKLWEMWRQFREEWIPEATKGEDFVLVHNGDVIDGVHHNSTTQISHNLTTQRNIAEEVLSPLLKMPQCKGYYHIRGTEAHVGKSGQDEEAVARSLNAIKDKNGNSARWELLLSLNKRDILIHFTHHVGTTSSASYESTAVYKELIESYNEAGRWGRTPPDVVVRSHRHRQFETRIATAKGYGIALVTPSWQLKTPFTYRIGLGRSSSPQIGGYLIRSGSEDHIYTRFKVWSILDRGGEKVEI